MAQTARKPEILTIARREGKVIVDDLVSRFQVSHQTIRRDLSELADSGRLERIHGGAILPSKTTNIEYEDRRNLNHDAKTSIAQRCAVAIPNDCSLFLNIGTTTEAIAKELMLHEGLLVVTNNINIALILSANKSIDVVVTGGNLRRSDGGMTGDFATQTIRQFRFDYAVIGCSALNERGDMLDFDIQEVGVSKTIIEQSETVFLAADKSKFSRKAPAKIGSLMEVDCFFTDANVSLECKALCEEHSTRIVTIN